MKRQIVTQNILRFVLLLLLQMIVLNNIAVSNYVIPNILVLFILMLPTNTGRIPMLLISFGAGLLMDVCSNMLGFQAFSFTLVAMARIIFADRILMSNEPIVIARPSIHSVSFQHFAVYSALLLLIYYIAYVLLESFSFHNGWMLLLTIVLNVIVTWVLIIIYQLLLIREEE